MVVCGRKRKLFLRIVASDLNWLFGEGRRKGSNANLKFKIEYLKSTCHKDVRAQALLFRFTYATGALKKWITPLKLRVCGNIDEARLVFGTNHIGTQYQQDISGKQHFL
ncbi:hypothetical protein AO411_2026265 [Salmonella enterica subsp. enterica serovar Sarajane]|nr:hypothetical protein AO411_2026265 [Salmonella enterica subsp. enterica serovar Sarajane]